jgi:hypothetical protein
MNESEAKKYVKKTILTGNAKRIAEVVSHFQKAYGKHLHKDTQLQEAEKIFNGKV